MEKSKSIKLAGKAYQLVLVDFVGSVDKESFPPAHDEAIKSEPASLYSLIRDEEMVKSVTGENPRFSAGEWGKFPAAFKKWYLGQSNSNMNKLRLH